MHKLNRSMAWDYTEMLLFRMWTRERSLDGKDKDLISTEVVII